MYTMLSNAIDKYVETEECDPMYEVTRWMIFILCIIYLTFIGWKVSIFKKNPRAFIKQFWFQWLLFAILLTVQLTIPPMPCYFNNAAIIVKITWHWRYCQLHS